MLAVATLGAVVWIALGVGADSYTSHGYSADWYTQVEGARTLVTRTTEHRVAFPNVHRPLSRIAQGWDYARLPRPTALPSIDAELRARITIPDGPPRYLGADASRAVELFVDGRRAERRAITAGPHWLRVHWTGRPAPHGARSIGDGRAVRFELLWGPSTAPADPVPRDALSPADGSWPTSRVIVWWATLLGALAWMLLLGWAAWPTRPSGRARRWAAVATLSVVLLGTAYRSFDYDVMPELRENGDELFAMWNGWSLLEDGTTRGWSLWPNAYDGAVSIQPVESFGDPRAVISPYFEHPPLLHVLVGAATHLGGAHHWLETKLKHGRLVPIALSALSVMLLIAVGRRLYGPGPAAYLGGILYAVLPIIALQTRVIKEEALLVPLSLGTLWFFLRWRDGGKKTRDLALASVCAGLATIAKVPAAVFVPALVMLVAMERGETRKAALAASIGLSVASLWLVFGAVIDWDVFLDTQAKQGTRPTHWNLFPRFFDATLINHSVIGRGWILFLWLGAVASAFARGWRESAPVTVPLTAYLVAIAVGTGNWTFGWYIVPLYPFLCLGAGDYLARLWARPTFLTGTLFVVLLVMYTMNFTLDPAWAKTPDAWPTLRKMVSAFVVAFVGPYALVQVYQHSPGAQRLAKLATALGLAIVIAVSALFVVRYDELYERYHDFDRDMYFHR